MKPSKKPPIFGMPPHSKLSTQFVFSSRLPEDVLQKNYHAGNWPQLIRECNTILTRSPNHRWAHIFMAYAVYKIGNSEQALQILQRALTHWPNDIEILNKKAEIEVRSDRAQDALETLQKVLKVRPKDHQAWIRLSQAQQQVGASLMGLESAQKGIDLSPNNHDKSIAYLQKSIHERDLGNIQQSMADCKTAISLRPDHAETKSSLLLQALSDPGLTSQDIYQIAADYGTTAEKGKSQHPAYDISQKRPWQKLRIGFISPDFRNHAVAYFLQGLLSQFNRSQFEVIGFQLNTVSDHVTHALARNCDSYHRIAELSFDQRLNTLKSSQLDVLIDLAGHTGNNGLMLLTEKPAPIQISWLGFPATTGLTSIDYKITDEVCDPAGADAEYTEKLHRMQTLFCCYRPHVRTTLWQYQPDYAVKPAPAMSQGYITFGSCNHLAKLTDEVLSLWGQLLERVPSARLLIEGKNFEKPDFANTYLQRCESLGLPRDRLILVPRDEHNQYLTYHRIDIALDPFPLTGGTTSFDLLWMGVPLVSMEGTSFRSRMGTGMLTYLGKTEWLAHSPQEYVDIAVRLASDIEALNRERLGQREQVERSPLMNESLFLSEFGKALRTMWIDWLAQQHHPKDPDAQRQWAQQAWQQMPADWTQPAPLGVGLSTGQRISQPQAHALLNDALTRAQAVVPGQGSVTEPAWLQLAELAIAVLTAIPHDPVALHCLAQLEYAHGNQETGDAYLHHAHQK